MISGTAIVQTGSSTNGMNSILMNNGNSITQSGSVSNTFGTINQLTNTGINQLGTATNLFGAVSQLNGYGITQIGTVSNTLGGITQIVNGGITQSGTATNTFGNITQLSSAGITQSGAGTNTLAAISMIANTNFIQPSGNGTILQIVSNGTDMNTIKRTTVNINTGAGASGSALPAMEIFDTASSSDGRGCFIIPNSGAGSLNPAMVANDCGLLGRSTSKLSALTMSIYSVDRIGVRLDARTLGAPTVALSALTNATTMSKDYTTMTHPVKLLGTVLPTNDLTIQGGIFSGNLGPSLVNSTATLVSYTGLGIAQAGVYIINFTVTLRSTGVSTLLNYAFGICSANNAFDADGTSYGVSNRVNDVQLSLLSGKGLNVPMSTVLTLTGATTLYLNYILNFTGGSTYTLAGSFQFVRIA
jgi:hypothetical protein